jgi:hypothetical protein
VLIRRLPGSLAALFQMTVFGRAARAPTTEENSSGGGCPGFVDGRRENADPAAF